MDSWSAFPDSTSGGNGGGGVGSVDGPAMNNGESYNLEDILDFLTSSNGGGGGGGGSGGSGTNMQAFISGDVSHFFFALSRTLQLTVTYCNIPYSAHMH